VKGINGRRVTKTKKPEKFENVLEEIKKCIQEGKYALTVHALVRQSERRINLAETLHVLKTGYEEKRKTCFDIEKNTWKYAIRGKTIRDELDVRVIIAFNEDGMFIITVIQVEKLL